MKITRASTIVRTNNPAPNIEPITKAIPSVSCPPAVKDVIISGAPFAKASRVTPATISESLRSWEILDIAGARYFSVVDERKWKQKKQMMN